MKVVTYLGGELAYDFFVGGGVYLFKGCSEDFCIFSFHYPLDTLSLVHWSCDHLVIANLVFIIDKYIWWGCYYIFSLIAPYVVSFLSLYICFLFMYPIFYFCFTLRCFDEFCLKCFKNTGCQNLPCHELSFCKVFQEFVLG